MSDLANMTLTLTKVAEKHSSRLQGRQAQLSHSQVYDTTTADGRQTAMTTPADSVSL